MTPMFDEEPIFPLVFAAVTSLGLSLVYFSKWFSEFSSRPSTGRVCALLSITLMARSNSPTLGHPKFPQAGPPDYDDSGATAMRAAASLRR